ncbi:MAG: indoleamine 2,3-dioxygenase, partial [Saprospiraceae bacterium]
LDLNKPIQLDNLATLFQFHGGLDESWFYLVTVQIEKIGGPAIPSLLEGIAFLEKSQSEKAIDCLERATLILKSMTETLRQMYLHCEPPVFYKRIRPFLDSFVEVEYQGTLPEKRSFHGGSAAQSSLIQFFDAILGNRYDDIPSTNHYLLEMRKYMPPKHAAFLRYLETKPSFKDYAIQNKKLEVATKNAIDHLIEFRNEHLKMVSIYIMKQAKATNAEAVGTGGTNPMLFLKSIRNKNQK